MRPAFLDSRRCRALLPALAPPAAIVAVWVFGLGTEPADVSAGQTPDTLARPAHLDLDLPSRPRVPRDAERAAAARAAELRAGFDLDSPFGDPDRQAREEPEERPEPVERIGLDLTSLMDTPRGAIAIINGRPYRVGDVVDALATVESIDVGTRTVSLTLPDGESVELTLERAGIRRSD